MQQNHAKENLIWCQKVCWWLWWQRGNWQLRIFLNVWDITWWERYSFGKLMGMSVLILPHHGRFYEGFMKLWTEGFCFVKRFMPVKVIQIMVSYWWHSPCYSKSPHTHGNAKQTVSSSDCNRPKHREQAFHNEIGSIKLFQSNWICWYFSKTKKIHQLLAGRCVNI